MGNEVKRFQMATFSRHGKEMWKESNKVLLLITKVDRSKSRVKKFLLNHNNKEEIAIVAFPNQYPQHYWLFTIQLNIVCYDYRKLFLQAQLRS